MNQVIIAIQDGGIWMAPIIIAFVFALTIAAERFYVLFISLRAANTKTVVGRITKEIQSGQESLVNAHKIAQGEAKKNKAVFRVLAKGLAAAQSGNDPSKAMDEMGLVVFPEINKRMPFLPMLANVATLSGLLGTIVGLIEAFDAVANAAPDQKQIMLARGISKAMYTTAGGLVVAIPTLILNSLLTSVATKLMDDIDHYSTQVSNSIRSSNKKLAAK
jgi:biopolymer transport protein ExbB